MRKIICTQVAVMLLISVLVLTVSCQKKSVAVQNEPVATAIEEDTVEPAEEEIVASPADVQESESEKRVEVVLQENVYFEFDKSFLTEAARESLLKNGEWLRLNSDVAITIEGHCDERGTNDYNLALGDRRAESVKAFLIDLGIDASRMGTITYGEERPAVPGHNEAAYSKNRRAYFLIK